MVINLQNRPNDRKDIKAWETIMKAGEAFRSSRDKIISEMKEEKEKMDI